MARYLINSGSRAIYSFSTCPAMTWESGFASNVFAPSAFALLRPSIRPLYFAILFVALNSNLVSYFVRRSDGAINTTEALAPRCPKPCLNRGSKFVLGVVRAGVPKVSNLP